METLLDILDRLTPFQYGLVILFSVALLLFILTLLVMGIRELRRLNKQMRELDIKQSKRAENRFKSDIDAEKSRKEFADGLKSFALFVALIVIAIYFTHGR